MTARSKAHPVFARPNSRVVGFNSIEDMDICVCEVRAELIYVM
jgi:hypothetical protein